MQKIDQVASHFVQYAQNLTTVAFDSFFIFKEHFIFRDQVSSLLKTFVITSKIEISSYHSQCFSKTESESLFIRKNAFS